MASAGPADTNTPKDHMRRRCRERCRLLVNQKWTKLLRQLASQQQQQLAAGVVGAVASIAG